MMAWLENWNCDICHEKRPDAKIDVLTKDIIQGDYTIHHNIKYCNDRQGCKHGAENMELFSDKTKEERI